MNRSLHPCFKGFYGFRLCQSTPYTKSAEQKWFDIWPHEQDPVRGLAHWNKLKQTAARDRIHFFSALQAEKNVNFSLQYIINLSMRACSRWKMPISSARSTACKHKNHTYSYGVCVVCVSTPSGETSVNILLDVFFFVFLFK